MTELNLEEIRARAEKAAVLLDELCDGRQRWTMRIPADEHRDSDLVLGASLNDVPALIAEVERLSATVVRVRDLLDRWNANGALSGENGTRFLDRHELLRALVGEEATDGGQPYMTIDVNLPPIRPGRAPAPELNPRWSRGSQPEQETRDGDS